MRTYITSVLIALTFETTCKATPTIIFVSKRFTESYVLGEIAKRVLDEKQFAVEHKQGMGGGGIVWTALKTGEITLYPEYTGTIQSEILKLKSAATADVLRSELAKYGVGMT